MRNLRLVYSSSVAASLAIIFVVVFTIWAELSPTLKTALKDLSGHHWVSKSILVVLIYLAGLAVFYYLPKNINSQAVRRGLTNLIIVTIIGTLAIFLFFVWHYLGAT